MTVNVNLVQWASDRDPAVNRARLTELEPGADLVVLPEAFARDFGPPDDDLSAYAEPLDGPFGTAVEAAAERLGSTVVAGMFEETGETPYNTLLVRGDAVADYRKIHLYDSFGYRESDRLSGGPLEPVTFPLAGLTFGLMTCYDLRFPELARLHADAGVDALVVPAAWVAGDRKVDHWRTLVRARAIENTVYVIAVGQPAPRYSGHSMVVDPLGDVVVEAGEGEEMVTAELTADRVVEARRTNPSLANRRL